MADAKRPELLPCPFCGSDNLTLSNLLDDDDWSVNCNVCDIQQIANYTKAEAAAQWNMRLPARDLLAALAECRSSIARYCITRDDQTKPLLDEFLAKIMRTDAVARAAIAKATGAA